MILQNMLKLFWFYLEAFFELLNVEGALTQNKRMFPTALFWAIQILRFKKVCQMISKHYETGFVKNIGL